MTRRVSTRALVAHHLRSRAGGGVLVAVLVFVLSLVATAAPIALGLLGDAALRDRLDGLAATERDVVSQNAGLPQIDQRALGPSTEEAVWSGFLASVEDIRTGADEPLPALLGTGRAVTLSSDNALYDGSGNQATVAFAPGIEDDIRLVDGRMPEPAPAYSASGEAAGQPGELLGNRIEVVMSAPAAEEMEWPVGEVRTTGLPSFLVELVLVGTFEAVDAESDVWQHVPSSLTPRVFDDGNAPRTVTGMAFAHPASLIARGLVGKYTTSVWYPFDVGRIDADTAERTVAALNRLTAVSNTIASSTEGLGILSLRFEADVTAEIELALAQGASTAGVIAMLVAGPVGVAAAVLVLGCRLILESRRPSLRLLSARGASLGQLRGLLGGEGALVGAVPAVLGAAAAAGGGILLFGVAPGPLAFLPAVLLALAPIVILVVLAPSVAERQVRTDLGRRGSRLRLIAEGVVAGLAGLALVLLFVRGYSAGVDLLLAATPLLLALVACLLTLRLYPLPLRAVLGRARRSAGLDAFLGAARALREPSIGLTPVLALVVGVSVAVSSGILLSALQTGVADASRAQIGADVRITGASFTRDQLDRVGAVEGVAAATGISGADPATIDVDGVKRGTSVFVVDAAGLRAVQGEGPGMLPPGVSLEPSGELMPIVVSGPVADRIDGSGEVSIGGVDAAVVGVTRGPVPVGARENWAAIDSSYAAAVLGRDPSDRTLLVRLAEGASIDEVEPGLRAVLGPSVRIDTAAEVAGRIQSGPAVQGVRFALLAATAIAALLSALAVVMTLTLAAAPRARTLALLRTLGAPSRSATSLGLWEIGPPAVAAVVAGTVFGALVPLVVLAAVDLRPFTGSSLAPAYQLDPAILALTLGGFVLLAALLTGGALLVSRRIRAAGALRTAEEG